MRFAQLIALLLAAACATGAGWFLLAVWSDATAGPADALGVIVFTVLALFFLALSFPRQGRGR